MGDGAEDIKRRVRAAWAFSGLSYDELAERTGIKRRTIDGYLGRSKPSAPGYEDRQAIADACGVPRSFMEEGFSERAAADERVAELEAQMGAVGVLLPLLVKAAGYELPPRAAQALARVQNTTG
jgi:transcriptional regulator with XRE-family HTH domain